MEFIVVRSPLKKYIWRVQIPGGTVVDFGDWEVENYTQHRNLIRTCQYLTKHYPDEDWETSGIRQAPFWTRWLLWNKPTLTEAIADTAEKFNLVIRLENRDPSKSRAIRPTYARTSFRSARVLFRASDLRLDHCQIIMPHLEVEEGIPTP